MPNFIIITNIKNWTLWSVPSPKLQLLSPTFLRSSNCSLSLWSVSVWLQRDSVLCSEKSILVRRSITWYLCGEAYYKIHLKAAKEWGGLWNAILESVMSLMTKWVIITNIKDWTFWSVPSPKLQLLSPTFLRSSNCSPFLWSVAVWFQRDSVLCSEKAIPFRRSITWYLCGEACYKIHLKAAKEWGGLWNVILELVMSLMTKWVIIINIKDWTLWSVPSPKSQLLSPTFLRSSNCSPSLWPVVVR